MDRSIMDMKKKKKKITLISSNDMTFDDIDLSMLYGCRVIKRRIEKAMCEVEEEEEEEEEEEGGDGDDKIIILRVPEITGKILSLVLEFCTEHGEEDYDRWQVKYATDEDLKRWQAKLATEVDEPTLAHLVLATDYLEMWELAEVVLDVLSDHKGKSPLEFAELFDRRLESEEEEVSRAKLWT